MKKVRLILLMAMLSSGAIATVATAAMDYPGTIDVFKQSPAVKRFFDNSYGYAVFPTIGKAGWVIGGSFGKGQVTGETSMIEGSIGFQLGGKAFSEIIFFQDKRAYEELTSGNFEFGATAQAIVVTAGAQAKAGTGGASASASAGPKTGVQAETDYINGMAVFVHPKGGLMYELSIGGQKFTFEPY